MSWTDTCTNCWQHRADCECGDWCGYKKQREIEFTEWLNKYWQLCHVGGTLYQRINSYSFTKKYTIEMLRELFNNGWPSSDNNEVK